MTGPSAEMTIALTARIALTAWQRAERRFLFSEAR